MSRSACKCKWSKPLDNDDNNNIMRDALLQVMTAMALQRRLQNVGITLSSVDPGAVSIHVHIVSL